MQNGDLDGRGLLTSILYAEGTIASFKVILPETSNNTSLLARNNRVGVNDNLYDGHDDEQELLSRELPDAQVLEPTPGEPLEIPTS